MSGVLVAVAWVWQHRGVLLVPMLVLPMLVGVWFAQQPVLYRAEALLQVNPEAVSSPALREMNHPMHVALLQAALREPELIARTVKQTGIPIDATQLQLQVISNALFRVIYVGGNPTGLDVLVDTLALNFIQELLGPERYRTEQKLAKLEQQLQTFKAELAGFPATKVLDDAAAIQRTRLTTQLAQTEQDYKVMLSTAQALQPDTGAEQHSGAVWFNIPATVSLVLPPYNLAVLVQGAAGLGLLLGLCLVLLRTVTDASLRSDEDVMQTLGQRILARIPRLGQLQIIAGQARVQGPGKGISLTDYAEFTRLYRASLTGFQGTLAVVATQPGEGSSLLSYTLAVRSAEDKKPTLFIDLNSRNSGITKQIGLAPIQWSLPERKDLASIQDAAVQLAPNLFFLPAASDLASSRFLSEGYQARQFFGDLSKYYTHIIVDTTPLKVTNRNNADPLVIAGAVDRVVPVILAGVTPRQQILHALRDLATAGARVIGVVLNDRDNLSARETLQVLIRRLEKPLPGLASWLQHKLQASKLN